MNTYIQERYKELTQNKTFRTEAACDAVIKTIKGWYWAEIVKVKLTKTGEYAIAVDGMILPCYVNQRIWSLLSDATLESHDFDSDIVHEMENNQFWLDNPYEVISSIVVLPTDQEIAIK